jgi:crotonobetainyl-CoA:carnitine CoA-transferase CaiB-like acyl-CoA transferase
VQRNQHTAKALAAGDISPAHVQVAARAARHVEDLYANHEDGILDAARLTNPEQFKVAVNHWRNLAEAIVDHEPAEARFDGTPAELRSPAPVLGEHTDTILAELGVPAAQLSILREAGVVA